MEQQPKRTDFSALPEQPNFPDFELDVLDYWQKIDAFKTQLEKTKDLPPYTFYDGPPFATGTPHYGHICAGTIKDVVTRYATQTGHYVERRFGWDCHGLPIEHEIDKQHKINRKEDILAVGVDVYNGWCRDIVMKFEKEWRKVVNRMGRWIDFDNDYKTMDITFMESVWWVFQQLWNKGLVYRGAKVMPYSLGCATVLSNFEAGENFKDVDDPSVYVSFPLVEDPEVKLVAWTTTPWTLPSNLALCVNRDFDYVKIRDKKTKEVLVMAKVRLPGLYKKADTYEVLDTFKGATLEGKEYVPLFDYFAGYKETGGFRVLLGDHVTDDAGTGVVHTAPGFGADDYKVCVAHNIIKPDSPPLPVDASGYFTEPVSDFVGKYVKHAKTEDAILLAVRQKGRLVAEGRERHSYPFCYRSDTPLIYRAVNSWFINVKSFRDDLLVNNKKAYWVPAFAQEKRFHNWLENAEDWCFSRNRFWGNPIPIWVSEDFQEQVCVGSIEELRQLSGVQDIKDLHTDTVDKITIPSKQGKGVLRRIEEVFDCWFESGSMPFAQCHYPFSMDKETFEKRYPADFIGEGLDQTRGWFYTLNVLATAVTNQNPYKNVIVNGLVLAEDGKKMSKREKNYTDPMEIVGQHGADAVRLYLMNSPLVKAEPLRFKDQDVRNVVKNVLIPWYNVCRFLIQNISRWEKSGDSQTTFVFNDKKVYEKNSLTNIMDRWIIAANQNLIKFVRGEMEAYRLYTVVPRLLEFLEDLTNTYVRLNKNRFKGDNGAEDQRTALDVLFDVLLNVTILMSPFAPFTTEVIYQLLVKYVPKESSYFEQSVHFLRIPKFDPSLIDEKIERAVKLLMDIIRDARFLRVKKSAVRQPVKRITLITDNEDCIQSLQPLLGYVQEELNVEEDIVFERDIGKYIVYHLTPDHRVLGSKLQKAYTNDMRKALQSLTEEDAKKFKSNGNKLTVNGHELTSEHLALKLTLKSETLSENFELGGETEVKVLLDMTQDEEMRRKLAAKKVVHKIQKLRKDAGLKFEDDIVVFLDYDDSAKTVKSAVESHKDLMYKLVKRPLCYVSKLPAKFELLAAETAVVEDEEVDVLVCQNPFAGYKGDEEEKVELPDLDQTESRKKKSAVKEVAKKALELLKKCKVSEDDKVDVFVNFGENAKNLREAVEVFKTLISKNVEKPLHLDQKHGDVNVLDKESFTYNGEGFEVLVCGEPVKAGKGEVKSQSSSAKDEETKKKTASKEVANMVLKLRRSAGVTAEDDVVVFLDFKENAAGVKSAFESNKVAMEKVVKKPLESAEKLTEDFEVVAKEALTYDGEDFEALVCKKKLVLTKEVAEATVKEVVKKVKGLKRSAGVDDFVVFVGFGSDSKVLKYTLETSKDLLEEAVQKTVKLASELSGDFSVLAKETFKFKGEEFEVVLAKK